VCPIGCSSHLGVEWDSVARLGGVVARIVVGPVEGQAVLEDVVDYLSLSTI
jgi:hypothetical protein